MNNWDISDQIDLIEAGQPGTYRYPESHRTLTNGQIARIAEVLEGLDGTGLDQGVSHIEFYAQKLFGHTVSNLRDNRIVCRSITPDDYRMYLELAVGPANTRWCGPFVWFDESDQWLEHFYNEFGGSIAPLTTGGGR